MTEREFTVNWGGISFGRGGGCVCVFVRGVLLEERGVTEREFTVDWGGFRGGFGAEYNVAERSVA